MSTEPNDKKVVPKVVTLNKAFKAEVWVKNMSNGTAVEMEKLADIEIEGRPARLGLGARITPNTLRAPIDPVERKLLGKVNAKRKQSSENEDKLNSGEKNNFENEDETDEPESRTNDVAKKRPMPLPTGYSCSCKKEEVKDTSDMTFQF